MTDQSLEGPLRHYLNGLPTEERKRVIPTKKRKQRHCASKTFEHKASNPFENEALKYLRAKQDARKGSQTEDYRILRMTNALAYSHNSRVTEKKFWGILSNESRCLTESPALEDTDSRCSAPAKMDSPLQRLLALYQKTESSTHLHMLALRILKVLIHHQFKLLIASGVDSEARQRQMLQLTGITIEDSKDLRVRATGWLRFMSIFGVGALAIVEAQANDE